MNRGSIFPKCLDVVHGLNDGDKSQFIGTFMGRDALSLLVTSLDLGRVESVLLPAYLCREVLNPFMERTRVEFYDLQPDLVVSPAEIESKLAGGNIRLVYLINYFGFLQPHRRDISKICADRGVVLVEDCAHSLLTEGSGETGDILVYSLRKILPLPDGGGLRIRRGSAIDPDFYPLAYSNVLSVLSLAKTKLKLRSTALSRSGISAKTAVLLENGSRRQPSTRVLPLSSNSIRIMSKLMLPEIVEKRRGRFQFWRDFVDETQCAKPVFHDLPPGVCPLGFPILLPDRDAFQETLEQEGIHLQVHWPLPSAVRKEFTRSQLISATICTLPVNPELGSRERDALQRVLLKK